VSDVPARLSQGERIVLVAGVLLIADLLFLPWYDIDLGPLDEAVNTTATGVQQPYAGYGIAAVVLTLAMIAQIAVAKLLSARLPDPPVPWSQIHLILGIFVAVALVIKLVRLTDSLGYGAYSAILAGILVAYGGYRIASEPHALALPTQPEDRT
jgi:phosphoglycerol transferase MdoB-like AlkP superfamily enzyme